MKSLTQGESLSFCPTRGQKMAWSYQLPPWILILVCHFTRAAAIKVCPLEQSRNTIRINLNVPLDEHSLYFWTSGEDFEYTVQSPAFPSVLKKVMAIREANGVRDDLGGWWYVVPRNNMLWDYCKMIVHEDDHAKTLWLCTSLGELYVTFPRNVSLGSDCKTSGRASAKLIDFRLPMLGAALVLVALFGACRLLLSCRENCRKGSREGAEGGESGGGGGPQGGDPTAQATRKPSSETRVEDPPPAYDEVMQDAGAPPPPYTSLKIENLPPTV